MKLDYDVVCGINFTMRKFRRIWSSGRRAVIKPLRDTAAAMVSVMDLLWLCGLACAIFLGGAAKDTEMMTYAHVHRNPLVTESVPKFRPEVHCLGSLG